MVTGIIGRKLGMTQVFDAEGVVTPVTVLKAGPCVVVQAKTTERDGYEAVQIGLVEEKPARVNKALAGHYGKAKVPPTRVRREVRVAKGAEAPTAGAEVVCSIFAAGDSVDVVGTSKGKGFQGVIKRHNFSGWCGDPWVDVPPGARRHRCLIVPLARHQGEEVPRPHGRGARHDPEPEGRARRCGQPPGAPRGIGAGRARRLRGDSEGRGGQAEEAAAGRDEEEGQEIGAPGY